MFDTDGPEAQVKIIDFGLAQKYSKYETLKDKVGTITTMSPEVLRGEYTSQADMWSIGVIAYQLLCGELPFTGETRQEIATNIVKLNYCFDQAKWKSISKEAKDFVKRCLQPPKMRYTAHQALSSPWLSKETKVSVDELNEGSLSAVKNSIERGSIQSSEFRKIALQAVARKTSTSEIVKLREVFHAIDEDHDGLLTMKEIKQGFRAHYGEKEIESWFQKIDADDSGSIDYTEFLAATLERKFDEQEERVADAFRVFDKEDKGYITPDNLRSILGTECTDYVDQLIREADANKDGQISYEEFKAVLTSQRAAASTGIRGL
jgi:calcium-dependent protein kinase